MNDKVLVVGLLCVDIVSYVDDYPVEDTDQNCKEQVVTTGGNAANSCKVLKQLQCNDCVLFSSLNSSAEDWASQVAENQLNSLSVNISKCPIRTNQSLSVSIITVNEKNGSRTILHHKKGLLEPTFDEFVANFKNLNEYALIHFEGRNVKETRLMIDFILKWKGEKNSNVPIVSVELEKARPVLKELAVGADFVFIGKDFAQTCCGFNDMTTAVEQLSKFYQSSNVFCAWGERGACVMTKEKELFHCPAVVPDRVIDTLGAGDTFIAGCISRLSKGDSCEEALKFGCRVAGAKCCVKGFAGFKKYL